MATQTVHITARGHERLDHPRSFGYRRRGDALLALGRQLHCPVGVPKRAVPAARAAFERRPASPTIPASPKGPSGPSSAPGAPRFGEIRAPATVRSGTLFL
jgi:hypothetical protein